MSRLSTGFREHFRGGWNGRLCGWSRCVYDEKRRLGLIVELQERWRMRVHLRIDLRVQYSDLGWKQVRYDLKAALDSDEAALYSNFARTA
jgi:hypothetical protein